MTERPVLFFDEMVRAIRAGTKTQTRRVIQAPAKNMQRAGMCVIKNRAPGDPWYGDHVWSMRGSMGVWGDYTDERFRSLCPYGATGDRLWVREAWGVRSALDVTDWRRGTMRDCTEAPPGTVIDFRADYGPQQEACFWRPSIHMPRWASRLTLEVTNVRVERVQAISGADALAEGITIPVTPEGRRLISLTDPGVRSALPAEWRLDRPLTDDEYHRALFGGLWDSLAEPGSRWADNPWVWVVEFRRAP